MTDHPPPLGVKAGANSISIGPAAFAGVTLRYQANEEIFGEGEPADYVYALVSGAIRVVHFTGDGRRQILAFHLPGDVFGLDLSGVHEFAAEAICESQVVLVRRSAVETAATESLPVARALIAHQTRLIQDAFSHSLVLGLKGAGERVASFLLTLSERATPHAALRLPMSRADIADHLALTIETVSRTLTQMERDRTIALPSAREVIMQNRMALERLQAA